ncbi:MAG: calcium-binding protein [Alphaproteobacteria bacterium]
MGTLTANTSLDLLSGNFWYGSPDYLYTDFTPNTVIFTEPDRSTAWLHGTFNIDGQGNLIDGIYDTFYVVTAEGVRPFEGTGFALGVVDDLVPYILTGDSFGLVAATLAQDDEVLGSDAADTLVGMDGNDVVNGNGGDDDLNGNLGNDLVTGGSGRDYVRGGQGDDTVRGGADDDWHVNGSIGNDLVYGDLGNDSVYGGQGADQLDGGQGDDWLSGDLGNDTLTGGTGADRFVFRSGSGADRVADFHAAEGDNLALQANLNGTGVDTFAELQARIAADGQGNTTIDLGGGNSLILLGVQPAALSAANISFFFD